MDGMGDGTEGVSWCTGDGTEGVSWWMGWVMVLKVCRGGWDG